MLHTKSRRVVAIVTATVFYGQLLATLAPRSAQARVEPLTRITAQVHKPNMLILLDTSGSLDGVPGGTFATSTEVGVDCDDGDNCRGGDAVGTCRTTGKGCSSDGQCTVKTCQSGYDSCTADSDCAPISGTCSSGQACYVDADCPALTTGHCATTNTTCTTKSPCSVRLRCTSDAITCASNTDCKTGLCANNVNTCNTSNDCPYATSGGTCAMGTTPTGGCASAANCPTLAKVCSDNPAHTCTTVNDCGGTCKKAGTACTSSANCTTKNGDSCDFSGKTCSSPPNSCIFPRQACTQRYASNYCKDTNTCTSDPNPCTGAAANHCLAGASGDTCALTSSSGGSKMCRIGQSICTRDSDCTVSGDSCGPATSRMVIAKRVIRNIVNTNANVVNMGLMTFYQAGYFPYYPIATATTTTTKSESLQLGQIMSSGCYSKKTGLQTTCTTNGKTYALRASNNAKYLIKGSGGQKDKYVDATYCGWFCEIPGVGTGVFKGAYYDYTDVVGTVGAMTTFTTYRGKVFTQGGVTYRYYDSRPDYYNGGAAPPISTVNCGNACSATCGARWDTQLAPFLTTNDTQANIDGFVAAVTQAMQPADNGGLIAYNGTPSGCALQNDVASDKNHSAYHYMQDVKAADTLSCRLNYVLFVTDGEANGPGDSNCTASACSASDPVAAGCTCRAVLSAYRMRINLGVKTFVVGFSTDGATGAGRAVNDNIAKAGGTDVGGDGTAPYSFGAANETELNDAIQGAIYQALAGSYSTSPATASQGTIQGQSEQSGTLLLDSRIDFPSWKGHLVAYDTASGAPVLKWDAASRLANMDWKTRRVYTSDSTGALVKIDVDSTTGAIRNKSALHSLGLGSDNDEAENIARWFMGDPSMKNPSLLGSIINSTPIDVGSPADGTSPGAHNFYLTYGSRPSITYVGSDDGMLHGFYTRDAVIQGVTQRAGNEAFAYMPRSMLLTATKLYAQGGQVADPAQHIYGLASSPKVKSVCVDNCEDGASAVWKTVLVMTEGWGGNGMFMLDITDPTGTTPFGLLWSAADTNQSSTFGADLGSTISVPAFTFLPGAGMNDHRVIFSSGYPVDDASTTQGRFVVSASVKDGTIKSAQQISPGGTACSQDYALLTDVGTSRRHMRDANGVANGRKEMLAGYFGDTWGNLWQYSASTGGVTLVAGFGCQHPLHFAPTVVQMDADDPNNVNAGDIYLVQVTNSSLDQDTKGFASSKMVIIKQKVVGTEPPAIDTTFGTNGMLVMTASDTTKMCAVTNNAGTSCTTALPSNARPLATPTGVIKPDGTGFVLLSNWYAPDTTGCGKGATYFQLHDFSGSTVTLKQALKIADEPVVNPIIVNGTLMISSSSGPISIAGSVTLKVTGASQPIVNIGDLFQMTGWSELE
jgi:hypothetical protein